MSFIGFSRNLPKNEVVEQKLSVEKVENNKTEATKDKKKTKKQSKLTSDENKLVKNKIKIDSYDEETNLEKTDKATTMAVGEEGGGKIKPIKTGDGNKAGGDFNTTMAVGEEGGGNIFIHK